MKLSELVAYRSALEQYDFHQRSRLFIKNVLEAKAHVDNKIDTGSNQQILFGTGVYQEKFEKDLRKVEEAISELKENFEYYRSRIDDMITERQEEYIKESEKAYIRDELPASIQDISERKLILDDVSDTNFFDRITQLSSWKYPGMIVRPQEQRLWEGMASSDPLYLVDIDQTLLDPLLATFNEVYRHRVRPYATGKYLPKKKWFGDLPVNQFGLIVCWNTLNNMPLIMCRQMLEQLFDLLRPGGTLLFTYNDCDNAHNVRNFENNFRQFTPGSRMIHIIEEIGYIMRYKTSGIHGWMELKKSGQLETIRGGQSLAQVISTNDVVITSKKTYTEEEIKQIHHEAIALGIDAEERINNGAIEPGKLELLIERRKHAIKEERRLIDDIGEQNSKDD